MNHWAVIRRGLAMLGIALLVVICGYPLAFLVTHGLDPAGWPEALETPKDWFDALAHGDLSVLFNTYAYMVHGTCPALARGGFPHVFAMAVGLMIVSPFVVLGGKRVDPARSSSSIYGSTDWASKAELARLSKGIEIGFDPATKRRVRISVEGNLLTIAPPRSGKTSGFILPNLTYPEPEAWSGPAVVIDPKGDAYTATKRRLEAMGKRVRCLDPLGLVGGKDRWNPLARVDSADVLYMQSVARALLPTEKQPSTSGAYFTNNAVDLIVGAMLVTISNGRPDFVEAAALLADRSKFHALLSKSTDPAAIAALNILDMEEKGRDAIVSTAQQATQWLRDKRMRSVVQAHTFEMTDLLDGNTYLFVVPPADNRKYILAPYLRWLLADLFAAFRSGPKAERLVVFIDEANVLGNFSTLLEGAGELPGYGISLWTFWQTRHQIIETYGEAGARVFLGTAEVTNVFQLPRNDPEETEYWSNAIGEFTGHSKSSGQDRQTGKGTETTGLQALRLVPRTDLPEFLNKYQVVLLNGKKLPTSPLKLGRTQAHEDRRFTGLIDPVAPVGPIA
jgi:type IV secretion system protein VirD4